MRRWLLSVGLVLVPVSFAVGQMRPAPFTISNFDVGSPFDQTLAYGINGNGQVTGAGYIASTGELDAFIWQNGVFQDLGMLGYPYGADGDAINNHAQLAATGYGPGYNALLYSNGHVTRLGGIDGGYSTGFSINNSGDIVGRAINGDGGGQGFSYIGGHFNAINVDKATSINDLDQYVGSMSYTWVYGGYGHSVEHAFLYANGSYLDLGNIGGGLRTNTEASSINNIGQVTGYSTAA